MKSLVGNYKNLNGSPAKACGLGIDFSKPKNFLSMMPLSCALNCLILALRDSAAALVERLTK